MSKHHNRNAVKQQPNNNIQPEGFFYAKMDMPDECCGKCQGCGSCSCHKNECYFQHPPVAEGVSFPRMAPSDLPENAAMFDDRYGSAMNRNVHESVFGGAPVINHPEYGPMFVDERIPNCDEAVPDYVKDHEAEGAKYIDPMLYDLGNVTFTGLPEDISNSAHWMRAANAIVVEHMADEMADMYRRHLSDLMELNTQRTIALESDNRKVMYHLVDDAVRSSLGI